MRKALVALFACMIIAMSLFGLTQTSNDSVEFEEETEHETKTIDL